jgi:ribonuclease HII
LKQKLKLKHKQKLLLKNRELLFFKIRYKHYLQSSAFFLGGFMDEFHQQQLKDYEKQFVTSSKQLIAGIDEAGRGPLAGPVVASACMFLEDVNLEGLNDSKQLSEKKRERLFEEITNSPYAVYSVAVISHEDVDALNIYQATLKAMRQSIEGLSKKPSVILIDGVGLPVEGIVTHKIIKGDTLSFSIAAASVLAKVTRDRLMREYDQTWPLYGFAKHKGYGTKQHREAIEKFGPCPIHRKSFSPVKDMYLAKNLA